jgi:integrase/recombinase XerD
MKRIVFLKRFYHRDKLRIGIFFSYDARLIAAVKAMGNVTYSKSNTCFYLDDTEDNIKLILRTLKDIADVDISAISGSDRIPATEPVTASHEDLTKDDGIILLRTVPYKSPPGSIHGKEPDKNKIIPAPGKVRSVINSSRLGPVEFTIKESDNLLVIKFQGRYDPIWIDEMKSYGHIRYDSKKREWLLNWTKITCDSLADYFASIGVEVTVSRKVVTKEIKVRRQETGDDIRRRELSKKSLEALEQMKNYLEDNRYSVKTSRSYLPLLEIFFKYYNTTEPEEITEEQVSLFVHDFIIGNGYSSSYQNQVISAIKTWYEISGTGSINPVFLERPRRGRALPKVFSKDEVRRILNAARNGKHKLILWMVYSCGLRRSEIINIRLNDLDRDRGILLIREGKGRIDRIVPVSEKVWAKIDEYIASYAPAEFLFEGAGGGRYSVESVYQVFKQALKRAGINKDVGVHSLRHSYATHLHESGVDIKYIQELLGHKSTKTTEIYTHVSRRNLAAVRSPIEDMDLN